MSFRKKTIKFGQTYGTPTTPTTTTPKAPSPKAPKIVRTVTTPTVTTGAPKTKPTVTRKALTPTEAGKIAQESFKTQLQAVTAPINKRIDELRLYLAHNNRYLSDQEKTHVKKGIDEEEARKRKIEEEFHNIELEKQKIELENNVNQIIQAIESGQVLAPDYFHNNIAWVKTGAITQQAFLDAYYYLSNQGIIHSPPMEPEIIIEEPIIELPEVLPEVFAEPQINDSITDNMVTQQVINFNIVNGRAVGSIKFSATNNFNSYYYGKNIVNIIQFKDPNGANILTYVKENRLNFTETERDEIINYNEDMQGNTRATVESFVWEWIDKPAGAFSKMYSINISETEDPKPVSTGILGAGVAGAIGILILLGFVADSRRKK